VNSPKSLCRKGPCAFALPESRRNRAVPVDKALSQKAPRLLSPNPLPHCVVYLHEMRISALLKATGEVSARCRSGMRWAPRPSRKASVIAPKLNILQPHSLQQRVVSQIQDMVAFMIRKVFLKQMQARVDLCATPVC